MRVLLHRPTTHELERALAGWEDSPLTYDRATLGQDDRFLNHQWSVDLLGGTASPSSDPAAVWSSARRALEGWQGHRRAGAAVTPPSAPLVRGQVVALTVRLAPLLWTVAGCRLVEVEDDQHRFGFAYGTLAGHPESGEERFTLVRSAPGRVTFEIEAWSRPSAMLTRCAGPVGGLVQQRITRRYLEGIRVAVGST